MCVSACECVHHVCEGAHEVQKAVSDPGSWSYRLWVSWCECRVPTGRAANSTAAPESAFWQKPVHDTSSGHQLHLPFPLPLAFNADPAFGWTFSHLLISLCWWSPKLCHLTLGWQCSWHHNQRHRALNYVHSCLRQVMSKLYKLHLEGRRNGDRLGGKAAQGVIFLRNFNRERMRQKILSVLQNNQYALKRNVSPNYQRLIHLFRIQPHNGLFYCPTYKMFFFSLSHI